MASDTKCHTAWHSPEGDFLWGFEMATGKLVLSTIFTGLGGRQARLEPEYEAAIFDDLESLYEPDPRDSTTGVGST